MNDNSSWLAVGGGWWLVVGSWRLVAVGSSMQLAVRGSWQLAVGGGWQLAVGGGWRLVVLGGCPSGLSLTKKKCGFLRTPLFATTSNVFPFDQRLAIGLFSMVKKSAI